LITPEGHLLTNSHVIRLGPGYCAQPPVQGDVAPLIVLLVTEDLQRPPIPRYVADLVTDDPHLDIAVLKISRELKEGLNNLQELEEKVSAAGSRDAFLNQWAKEGLVRSIPIQPLTLWDSDAALVGQRVTALGYPRPDDKLRNPSLNTDDRGNIQAKPEGFLRVGAAFAAQGSSGGAVVRAEEGREYLIGLICAGEFGTGQGVALARPINAAVDSPIKAAKLTINQAPVARFVPKPDLPRPRETVVFDALERSRDRDGSIQECQWQIKENGQSLTLPGCRVERSFPPDSRPKVTLAVRDDKGMSDAFTLEILLRVEEGPCRAKLRQASGAVQEFDSIQTAINRAGSGDVIEVIPPTPPRACAESVEIKSKRELTLRGARSIEEAPAFVLAGDGAKPTVLIADSENITLQGLTITQGNPGVRVEHSRAIRLKQSILKANRGHGILWVNSSGRVSDDSRLEGNLADLDNRFGQGLMADQKSIVDVIDAEIAGNAATGVAVTGESELKIEFVQIRENEEGLAIDGAKQVTLRDVKVYSNRKVGISTKNAALTIASSRIGDNKEDGLLVTDAKVEIKENTVISGNDDDGISAGGSAQVTLTNSQVSGNGEAGLLLSDSAQATLTNSQVSGNGYDGLVLVGSAQATLTNSQVSRNGYDGLWLSGSAQAVIENNEIKDNDRWGVMLFQAPCFETDKKFSGKVEGSGNTIEGNGKQLSQPEKDRGDGKGDVCPKELEFLKKK
jgi:parallel beta-helix repeat protein